MTLAVQVASGDPRSLIDGILAKLPVTDRVYFDLRHSQPLVEELVRRVMALRSSGRVLIVNSNDLLPRALLELKYQVTIWRVPEALLGDDLTPHVARTALLDDLLEAPGNGLEYDLIVLPYVLEAAAESPDRVLARLRLLLREGGSIVVASTQSGGLNKRLRAAAGRSVLSGLGEGAVHISLSWPTVRARRTIDPAELRGWCFAAGLRVRTELFVSDTRATVPVMAMPIASWIGANLQAAVQKVVPSLRNCLVAALTPSTLGRLGEFNGSRPTERPSVTVVVAVRQPQKVAGVLADLKRQTYPAELTEVITVEYGPSAANAALRNAGGEIVAFTDDHCRLPADWIECGVTALTGATVAMTGVVQVDAGSVAAFLDLPVARSIEKYEGLFPVSNSFYLKAAALEAGGFDQGFQVNARARWGWDSDLAHRLEAQGYRVGFTERLRVVRQFPPAASRGEWMREEFRLAADIPAGVRAVPGLRKLLPGRLFASKRTLYFDLMLAGLALALFRRRPAPMLLAVPWLGAVSRRVEIWPPAAWRPTVRHIRGIAARHVVWLAGFVVGSARARRVVL